jgi:ketosteroid isomerase-like protein
MTTEADREAAVAVLRDSGVHAGWMEAVEPDSPEWLVDLVADLTRAYREADLDWLLEHTHPEAEITQPDALPDARTYSGREAMIENFLDWPRQWEDFRIEPRRVFAIRDGVFVIDAIHRGRSLTMGVEVEGPVVWLFTYEGDLMRRWQMFLSVEEAVEAAQAG